MDFRLIHLIYIARNTLRSTQKERLSVYPIWGFLLLIAVHFELSIQVATRKVVPKDLTTIDVYLRSFVRGKISPHFTKIIADPVPGRAQTLCFGGM